MAVEDDLAKLAEERLEIAIKKVPQLSTEALKHRFGFHAATTEEKRNEHTSVRQNCLILALFINEKVPEGREKALAITALEEVMMWANAGIARNG
jgi:hypothetical protein